MPLRSVPRPGLRAILAFALVLCMLAATAGPALAISGSSSSGNVPSAEYPDNDAKKSDNLGGSTSAGGGSDKGGIPYTGFAIVVLAGLGVLAVTGGVSMRRAARDE